jgi:hypothetical protein
LQLEEKIEMRNIIIFSSLKILNIIDNPKKSDRDSLITYFSIIKTDPTFDPIENDLNSSGSIRLIRNKKLKSSLSNWTSDIVAVKEMENLWTDVIQLSMRPLYMSLGITRDLAQDFWSNKNIEKSYLLDKNSNVNEVAIGKSKSSSSLTEITNNRIIESLAATGVGMNKLTNLQSKALRNRIIEIINLIDSEIN